MLEIGQIKSQSGLGGASDPRLAKAAKDFEAMLLSELLKMTTDESQSDGDLNVGGQSYEDLRNEAVARAISANGGIGIGRMLLRHLGG